MVSFDGRVLILRWVDPEVQGRYGTMVYVRCGPEGAKRPAKPKAKPKPKPKPKPAQELARVIAEHDTPAGFSRLAARVSAELGQPCSAAIHDAARQRRA